MKGKTVIVTGASGGIGGAIVSELLERGADVIGACRRPQRLPEHPRLRGLELDLASFASVRRAAGMLEGERIYGIVSNAGIMPVRETVITADGLERTYQVNYEATRMFAELLLPQVQPGGVVVFTSSVARKVPRHIDDAPGRAARAADPWSRFVAYGRSKLLLWKLTQEMAPKLAERGIRVNCATPGVVDTGILSLGWPVVDRLADVFFRPFISTPRQGAKAALHALDSDETGRLYAQSGLIG